MQAGFFDLENRLGQRQLPGDSLPELGQTGDWKAFRPVVGANLQKSGEKALNLRNRCQSPTVRTSQHEPVLVCSRVKSLRRYRLAGLMLVILLFFPSLKADARGLGWPGATLSEMECYGGPQGYGPYNYVTQNSKVGIVERHHFTPPVERLVRGESSNLVGDLDYTLRAIPNHHRALWAMTRYYLRKAGQLSDEEFQRFELTLRSEPPPECYFQRAKLFAPQDGMYPRYMAFTCTKRAGQKPRYKNTSRLRSYCPTTPNWPTIQGWSISTWEIWRKPKNMLKRPGRWDTHSPDYNERSSSIR